MGPTVLGALKALAAGVAAGGAALAVLLGADPELVAAVTVVVAPVLTYLTPNIQVHGPQESAVDVKLPRGA